MSSQTYSAPSVRDLAAVVERIAPRDPARWEAREKVPGAGGVPIQVSEERAKQLWALVGMWDRAIGREPVPDRARRRVEQLFTRPALLGFWELAEAGELRHWAKDVGKPLPVTSLRIVRDCLAMLGRLVVPGRALWLPVMERAELKETVGAGPRAALYRELVDMAGDGPLERGPVQLRADDRTRLLAMVAIVLDAGTRSGELAALRMDDLADGLAAVGVRRRPQKAGPDRAEEISALAEVHPDAVRRVLWGQWELVAEATRQRVLAAVEELEPLPEVEWYPLREGTRVAVRRWLDTRERVVDALPLKGGRSALWVTLRESKAGPAGITILPGGLMRAYARGVTAVNMLMAGSHGWSPLPTTMEQLRRAVDVQPVPVEELQTG